jgi:hypothetical protein
VIIAEIGTDMGRFPTPGHLASWAKFAPGVKQSAGKTKGKATTGHGNPYLARVLGEAAVAAGRTDTFLGERYRRLGKRRGTKKAIVAVGRSILIIVWHLLADPTARFHDLGAGLLRHPDQPRPRQAQPRPPAGGPRLQGHPGTGRLTGHPSTRPDPAPPRYAGCCRLPTHRGFSDQRLPLGFAIGQEAERPWHAEGMPIITCWPAWRPRQAEDVRLLPRGSAVITLSGAARLQRMTWPPTFADHQGKQRSAWRSARDC